MTIEICNKLNEFHRNKGYEILNYQSPITGEQFLGEFNVSGFHNEVLDLAENPRSFWGVDKCMRLKNEVDATHSYLFSMGIFAKGINLENSFSDPFKDKRFGKFQQEIINQFLESLKSFGIDSKNLEATYLGGFSLGSNKNSRDRILRRKYDFPEDTTSQQTLEEHAVKCYPVKSLANIDIHPVEGSLVGPRVEIAYRDVEIGTIVFDCFKINDGKLIPTNYVGGYAIGIERLAMALSNERSLQNAVSAYRFVREKLRIYAPASDSALTQREVLNIMFGSEVLVAIENPTKLSRGQRKVFRNFKKRFYESSRNLGLTSEQIYEIISIYRK